MKDLTKGLNSILFEAAAANRFAGDVYNTLFKTLDELFEKRDFRYELTEDGCINEHFYHEIAFRQTDEDSDHYSFRVRIIGNGTIEIERYTAGKDYISANYGYNTADGADKIVSQILLTLADFDDNCFAPALYEEVRAVARKRSAESKAEKGGQQFEQR